MGNEEILPSKSCKSSSPDFNTPTSSCKFVESWPLGNNHSLNCGRHGRSRSLGSFESNARTEIARIRERLLRTNSHLQPSALKNFSRSQKMTLASLALVEFMSFCSMSIMAPFFPREAAEKGLSDTVSGFVFSFYALVMFVTSPIIGKIIPKVGTKFVYLSGLLVTGFCNIIFGLLEYIQDYALFTTFCLIIRGLEALGASAFSTAGYIFVINSFPDNIGSVLGILETFVGLGMSIGPALGGLLYSVGGFGLPFFVLGIAMIAIVPLNNWLLPPIEDCSLVGRGGSIFRLLKFPSVIVTVLVVVFASSTWGFLDPTLEPHLRQFNITPKEIGLIFLLFSALYGISSPAWGWLSDKIDSHWCMMTCGLFFSTVALVLLGPCPLTGLTSSLAITLTALSLLGVSSALSLLPTFQGILTGAIEGGCEDNLATYGVVAGLWSSMYSLGEVIGPALGGFLLDYYGFPITATVMACTTFFLGVMLVLFMLFLRRKNSDTENSESSETSPLLFSKDDYFNRRLYTEEKIYCYEYCRKLENQFGETDHDQVTDVRGTVSITGKGACEV